MHSLRLTLLSGLLLLVAMIGRPLHAQPEAESAVQFSVAEPASGALGQDELRDIASTIRRLETYPGADGALEARVTLVQWLQGSPDLTVSICPAIASPFIAGEGRALRAALQQHLLSTAAYEIENPDADSPIDAKLSGLTGALKAYRALSRGEVDTDREGGIANLLQLQDEGKLRAFVEQGLERCASEE